MLIELDGQTQEVKEAVALTSALCREAGAGGLREAWDDAERARLWKGRKSAISALGRQCPSYYLQDGVVPRTALPSVLPRSTGSVKNGVWLSPMCFMPATATFTPILYPRLGTWSE